MMMMVRNVGLGGSRHGVWKFARRGLSCNIPTKEAIKLVQTENIGVKAVAAVDLPAGSVINVFCEPVLNRPTMHTVCLDETTHVAPTDGAEFISHACGDTNTRIIVDEGRSSGSFVVTHDVKKGDDLSFNYLTTEWHMNSPFECQCPVCQTKQQGGSRFVQGFKHLSLSERNQVLNEASPYVRERCVQEAKAHLNALEKLAKTDADEYFALAMVDDEEHQSAANA